MNSKVETTNTSRETHWINFDYINTFCSFFFYKYEGLNVIFNKLRLSIQKQQLKPIMATVKYGII